MPPAIELYFVHSLVFGLTYTTVAIIGLVVVVAYYPDIWLRGAVILCRAPANVLPWFGSACAAPQPPFSPLDCADAPGKAILTPQNRDSA